jgi:CheY-like chemotaxis protein
MNQPYEITSQPPSPIRQSILMIDDSDDLLALGKAVLESEGFDVVTASSGRQGLEYLSGMKEPDLVLLDLQMADMSGLDFLKKLEDQTPQIVKDVPVVFYTGREQIPQSKACGFILKEGGVQKFIDSVRSFIKDKDCGKEPDLTYCNTSHS